MGPITEERDGWGGLVFPYQLRHSPSPVTSNPRPSVSEMAFEPQDWSEYVQSGGDGTAEALDRANGGVDHTQSSLERATRCAAVSWCEQEAVVLCCGRADLLAHAVRHSDSPRRCGPGCRRPSVFNDAASRR
jgi:hypothetical protein